MRLIIDEGRWAFKSEKGPDDGVGESRGDEPDLAREKEVEV